MSTDGQEHSDIPVDPTTTTTQQMVSGRLVQIGDYRIVRKLGEGGCGIVFEAEQKNPRRLVALKVLRGDRQLSDQHIRLFEREAQTLARLHHPGIADIYEIGHTQEGVPFFTMELVRGLPLLDYIRKRSNDFTVPLIREEVQWRLDLFLQICVAINYAHQQGVIHRDLKPSNILILEDEWGDSASDSGHSRSQGRVKVLDFGLARMTNSDLSMTMMVSEVGQIKGTLSYMSPEQTLGDPYAIDIRTDIYSLGVILHEMLVGSLPYRVSGILMPEVINVIREEEPSRLSSLNKILRGDVETIAGKCLEKIPARRYQSVAAIIDDINRHLSDQPILACPPSATYQLRKIIARHRVPFIFAGSVFVLLLVFSVTMLFMFQEQKKAREIAEQAASMLITDISATAIAEPNEQNRPQQGADTNALESQPAMTPMSQTGSDLPVEKANPIATVGQNATTDQTNSPRSGVDQSNTASEFSSQNLEPQTSGAESEEKIDPIPVSRANDPPGATEDSNRLSGEKLITALQGNCSAAAVFINLGDYEKAEKLLKAAYPLLIVSSAEKESKLLATSVFIELYEKWGNPEKADHYRATLSQIDAGTETITVENTFLKMDF